MGRTAVLIDDDAEDLDIVRSALRLNEPGIHCLIFISPLEALHTLTHELLIVPEYIFLDINMPQMHGRECLSELRRLPQYDTAIITILSTSVDSDEKEELKKLGADHVFEKPAQFEQLQKILNQIIQK